MASSVVSCTHCGGFYVVIPLPKGAMTLFAANMMFMYRKNIVFPLAKNRPEIEGCQHKSFSLPVGCYVQ